MIFISNQMISDFSSSNISHYTVSLFIEPQFQCISFKFFNVIFNLIFSGISLSTPHIFLSLTRARAVPQGAPQGVSLSFQGQEKVLVTGPWYSQTEPYQILFGGTPVATTLVQSGVLRCFAPGKSFQLRSLIMAFVSAVQSTIHSKVWLLFAKVQTTEGCSCQ